MRWYAETVCGLGRNEERVLFSAGMRWFHQLDTNLDRPKFQPIHPPSTTSLHTEGPSKAKDAGLMIGQAERELAATFGVKPEAVAITIRS